MRPNLILEEAWRVKDEMAREAGHDVRQLCENTRQWALKHPHPGPVIRDAADLRLLLAADERRTAGGAMALNERPDGKA